MVRSVRRATGDSPGARAANRSITDGCSSTCGTGSRPKPIVKSASLPAAHDNAFARSRLPGAAHATAARAKHAACSDTDTGRQLTISPAAPHPGDNADTSGEQVFTRYMYRKKWPR